jgi:hypothetical protein
LGIWAAGGSTWIHHQGPHAVPVGERPFGSSRFPTRWCGRDLRRCEQNALRGAAVQWRAHVRNAYMRRSDVRNESPTCACYMLVQQRVCASRPTHGTNIAAGDETPARAIGICGNEQRSGRRTALNIDGSRSASHSTRREPIDMKRLASKPSPHVLAQAVALDLWQHGSERRPLRSSSSGSTAASDGCSEPHAVISYHCLMHPTRSTTSMWLASASRQVLAHIFAAALMRHVVLVTRLEHDDAASRLMGGVGQKRQRQHKVTAVLIHALATKIFRGAAGSGARPTGWP